MISLSRTWGAAPQTQNHTKGRNNTMLLNHLHNVPAHRGLQAHMHKGLLCKAHMWRRLTEKEQEGKQLQVATYYVVSEGRAGGDLVHLVTELSNTE